MAALLVIRHQLLTTQLLATTAVPTRVSFDFAQGSPYFQYDKSGGVKWTFGHDYIVFGVTELAGVDPVRALDKNFRQATEVPHSSQRRVEGPPVTGSIAITRGHSGSAQWPLR